MKTILVQGNRYNVDTIEMGWDIDNDVLVVKLKTSGGRTHRIMGATYKDVAKGVDDLLSKEELKYNED